MRSSAPLTGVTRHPWTNTARSSKSTWTTWLAEMLTSISLSSSPEGRRFLLWMTRQGSRSISEARTMRHIPQKTGANERSRKGGGECCWLKLPHSSCCVQPLTSAKRTMPQIGGYLDWERSARIIFFFMIVWAIQVFARTQAAKAVMLGVGMVQEGQPVLLPAVMRAQPVLTPLGGSQEGKGRERAGVLKPSSHPQRSSVHGFRQIISPPCTPHLFCWSMQSDKELGAAAPGVFREMQWNPGLAERVGFLPLVLRKAKISPLISAWASRWHRMQTCSVTKKSSHDLKQAQRNILTLNWSLLIACAHKSLAEGCLEGIQGCKEKK